MAALLASGSAAISHRSAGWLWGIAPRPAGPVEVTLIGSRSRGRPGIRMHRGAIDRRDLRTVRGIGVTSPPLTVLDLAATLAPDDFERAVAEAWARRLVRRSELQEQVDRNPHRPGVPALRELLELDRDPARTRSMAERMLLKLVRASELPEPKLNDPVGPHEVDCVWHEQRLVVEFDSWAFHSSRWAFERDRRKDAELLVRGYRVLRITWRRLTREPEAVTAQIARALGGVAH